MHPLRLGIKAQRLKRVFGIDMQTCECGGTIKAIACIEDPSVIKRILDHLASKEPSAKQKPSAQKEPSVNDNREQANSAAKKNNVTDASEAPKPETATDKKQDSAPKS